jgi:hypothetical protein
VLNNHIVWGGGAGEFFDFDDMEGAPQPKIAQIEPLVYPGEDNYRFREMGTRAAPTQIRTIRYQTDRAAAVAAITSYEAELDGTTIELIKHGQSFGNFVIVRFSPQPIVAVENVIGYVNSTTPTVIQAIDWIMLGAA